jgi:ABC-type multidrug transport system fused ATPase/permease subunit
VHHSTRSSGQIISKVGRGKQAFDDIISIATEDLFPMIVTLLTAATTLFFVDIRMGFIGLIFYALTTLVSSWLLILTTQIIEPKMIAADDLEKQVEVENLAQVALIRSSFATQIQVDKSETAMQKSFANWNLKWSLQHIVRQIVTYPFIAFTIFCIYYIVSKIDSGSISQSLGTSILVTVILNTGQILWINQKIERLIKATIEADDLFKFIRGFGKRTFPVLKQ